ncbi:MAG TPA: hypothetical protein PLX89_27700 [Verrucomicrobiota bacterium]|nr:hypothetical protein [Verrucomicrobiota bacterium]
MNSDNPFPGQPTFVVRRVLPIWATVLFAALLSQTLEAQRAGVAAWGELGVMSPETYKYPVRGDLLLEDVTTFAEGSAQIFGLNRAGKVLGWIRGDFETPPPTTPGFVAVAGGNQHGVALRSDGTVAAWGSLQFREAVTAPAGLNGVVAIAAGYYHTVALRGNGEVVGWGGETVPEGLNRVKSIAARYRLSAAIRFDGSLAVWGVAEWGETNVPAGLARVAEVALGYVAVAARTEDGGVTAWGVPGSQAPAGLSEVVSIKAGSSHFLALKRDGTVVAWGDNSSGQTNVPAGLSNVVAIAAGYSHSVALTQAGRVVAWGSNREGQTSIPAGTRNVIAISAWENVTAAMGLQTKPVIIDQPVDQRVPRLQNVRLSVTVAGFGLRYQWSRSGQLVSSSYRPFLDLVGTTDPIPGRYSVEVSNAGGSITSETAVISLVPALPGTVVGWDPRMGSSRPQAQIPRGLSNVVAISAGVSHGLALKDDGSIASWGDNTHEQLPIAAELKDVVAIDAGFYHSVALRGDGTVVVWGLRTSPHPVPPGLKDAVAIAAGHDHTMALRRNGTVVAWGDGAAAEVPAGLSGVVAIDAGDDLSVALTSSGQVVEWGTGGGSCLKKPRPPEVTNVVAIAAARSTTIVIKGDGRVEAWGNDCTGNASPPTSLRAIAVAGSSDQSFAIRPDGSLFSWGSWGLGYRPQNIGRTSAISVGGFVYEIVGPLPATRPRLVTSGDGLEVRWRSEGALGFSSLQVAETVDSTGWRPHPVSSSPENGWIRVPLNAEASQQFFRLIEE